MEVADPSGKMPPKMEAALHPRGVPLTMKVPSLSRDSSGDEATSRATSRDTSRS